jgi:hypothetical protein
MVRQRTHVRELFLSTGHMKKLAIRGMEERDTSRQNERHIEKEAADEKYEVSVCLYALDRAALTRYMEKLLRQRYTRLNKETRRDAVE